METWLITGCSTGIGRGIARAALAGGKQVVVTARNKEKVADIAADYPDTALAVALDVDDEASRKAAVKAACERFGGIDVLVNNAGYVYRAAIEEGEPEYVEKLFSTNFFGPIELIKLVLPEMRAKKSGAIVNLSSIAAIRSNVANGYYSAAKAAIDLASDALYKELRPLGIKVMIVEPGAFNTNLYNKTSNMKFTENNISDYDEIISFMRKEMTPDNHDQIGDPDKAGKVIVDVIGRDDTPKHLVLGSDCVGWIEAELKNRLEELAQWKEFSVSTDY